MFGAGLSHRDPRNRQRKRKSGEAPAPLSLIGVKKCPGPLTGRYRARVNERRRRRCVGPHGRYCRPSSARPCQASAKGRRGPAPGPAGSRDGPAPGPLGRDAGLLLGLLSRLHRLLVRLNQAGRLQRIHNRLRVVGRHARGPEDLSLSLSLSLCLSHAGPLLGLLSRLHRLLVRLSEAGRLQRIHNRLQNCRSERLGPEEPEPEPEPLPEPCGRAAGPPEPPAPLAGSPERGRPPSAHPQSTASCRSERLGPEEPEPEPGLCLGHAGPLLGLLSRLHRLLGRLSEAGRLQGVEHRGHLGILSRHRSAHARVRRHRLGKTRGARREYQNAGGRGRPQTSFAMTAYHDLSPSLLNRTELALHAVKTAELGCSSCQMRGRCRLWQRRNRNEIKERILLRRTAPTNSMKAKFRRYCGDFD